MITLIDRITIHVVSIQIGPYRSGLLSIDCRKFLSPPIGLQLMNSRCFTSSVVTSKNCCQNSTFANPHQDCLLALYSPVTFGCVPPPEILQDCSLIYDIDAQRSLFRYAETQASMSFSSWVWESTLSLCSFSEISLFNWTMLAMLMSPSYSNSCISFIY